MYKHTHTPHTHTHTRQHVPITHSVRHTHTHTHTHTQTHKHTHLKLKTHTHTHSHTHSHTLTHAHTHIQHAHTRCRHSARQHVPIPEYAENLKLMVKSVKDAGVKIVVLLTPPPVHDAGRKQWQVLVRLVKGCCFEACPVLLTPPPLYTMLSARNGKCWCVWCKAVAQNRT